MELATAEHTGSNDYIEYAPREDRVSGELEAAILAAVIYSDLFDYPLTLDELVRYHVGGRVASGELAATVANSALLARTVERTGGYFHLAGRAQLAAVREIRARQSRRLWRRALVYGRLVSAMPFVRMVAVTGALSVDNIGAVPDIDLLVVTRAGRVWIGRRALIAIVRLARLFRDDLCPNYVLADSHLTLEQRDFYTAHELAQMVPLSGAAVYKRLIRENSWAADYLPNAFGSYQMGDDPHRTPPVQRLGERVLSAPVFDGWERWELQRLQAKLRPLLGDAAEVACSPVQCKGHTGLHRQSVLGRFRQRAEGLGVLHCLPELLLAEIGVSRQEI